MIFEYTVNGKTYQKKICFNHGFQRLQNIYYSDTNPKNAMAEDEIRPGFVFSLMSLFPLFSLLILLPLLSDFITNLINIFK